MNNKLKESISKYRAMRKIYFTASDELARERDLVFVPGTLVQHIESGNICLVRDSDCPADQVALEFENHNVWWKPIEEVSTDLAGLIPSWMKGLK